MGAIGTIRKHSWIAVAIVGVAIVAFIIGDQTKNNNKKPDLGRIGSTTITYQRFNDMVEEQEQNYQRQYNVAQVPAEMQARIREGVWQQLVGETLTDAEFAKALAAVNKVTNINVDMVEDVFDEAGDLLAEAGDTDKFWAQMYGSEVKGTQGALQDHIPSMEDLENTLQEEVAGKITGAVTPESLEKEL